MHIIAPLMYVPDHFREARPDVLHDAMRRIGFAALVTHDAAGGLEANHLPMLLDGNVLRGHVARANAVWKAGECEALAIFLGPHAYVSPSWYPSKAATGKAVPTWNYITVHAKGRIRWLQDAGWMRAHVTRLSETHESPRPEPWTIGEAPESYIEAMLRGIVGFELEITQLDGKYKLTQNRERADREAVRAAYEGEGREDMARLMDVTKANGP
ncbi:MAG TPA: FMN-binding negative transcriptional regulator [Rhizomicrobium sp.]|jgi:transcriptional regulator|nr:FMN-binding negative transcriptional regulator [Rhizomicrobium sp.]